MRRLPSAFLALALTPALLVVPTITSPTPDPEPVDPDIRHVALTGVDDAALERLDDQGHEHEEDHDHAGGEGRTVVLTAPRATRDFETLGVTWEPAPKDTRVRVEVRTRTEDRWTDWVDVQAEPTEAPEAATGETRGDYRDGTAPYVPGPSDGVQVRVGVLQGSVPEDLRLELIDPGESDADAHLTEDVPAGAAHAATTDRPKIITRKQWGANESLRNGFAGYAPTIKAGFVHHTVSGNGYSRSDSASMVRGIYAYHTGGRGYSDVGYNFIVDKYGQIFEGRAGGAAKPVIGAHTGGFNYETFGVSALGNFETASAPKKMVNAYKRLMAWKLSKYGRNPASKVTLTSAGGGTSKYGSGTRVRVQRVSGHQHVGYTACPGKYLFAKLPAIRKGAATRVRNAASGGTPAPSPSPTPTPTPTADAPTESTFVPLAPAKVLDTRKGVGAAAGRLSADRDRVHVPVRGRAGIPKKGVAGVAVTVRAQGATKGGKLVVHPTGKGTAAQTADVRSGRKTSGHTSVGLGSKGRVTVRYAGKGTVHAVADVTGYYKKSRKPYTYHPTKVTTAYRTADDSRGRLGAGESRRVSMNGRAGIPANARGVVATLVVRKATQAGAVAVYPARKEGPALSTVYYQPGETLRRTVTVGLNKYADLRLRNRGTGDVHVDLEVSGYWAPTEDKDGNDLVAVRPARVADTRTGKNVDKGTLGAGGTASVKVAGVASVPSDVSKVRRAVVAVTAYQPTRRTQVTVDPWERWDMPPAVVAQRGAEATNVVVLHVKKDGTVSVRNSRGRTHVAVDVLGYYKD